jgi:hypothetical protein
VSIALCLKLTPIVSSKFVVSLERVAAVRNAWSKYSLSAAGLTEAFCWVKEFTSNLSLIVEV